MCSPGERSAKTVMERPSMILDICMQKITVWVAVVNVKLRGSVLIVCSAFVEEAEN